MALRSEINGRWVVYVLAWPLCFFAALRCSAQEAGVGPVVPETADQVIGDLAAQAAVIFAGQVLSVKGAPAPGETASEAVVEIDFRVDAAVRGCRQGSTYRLREWAGLWAAGYDRYQVGQRLLMFLHAPDSSGLSSPVHGVGGVIPLRGGAAAPGPDSPGGLAVAEWMVDLRWVQAQALRNMWIPEPVSARAPGTMPVRSPIRTVESARETQMFDLPGKRALVRSALLRAPEASGIAEARVSGPWVTEVAQPLGAEPKLAPLSQVLRLCGGAATGLVTTTQNRTERGYAPH